MCIIYKSFLFFIQKIHKKYFFRQVLLIFIYIYVKVTTDSLFFSVADIYFCSDGLLLFLLQAKPYFRGAGVPFGNVVFLRLYFKL